MSDQPAAGSRIDSEQAPDVDTKASEDVTPDDSGPSGDVGTPASSDPDAMTDISPDELGGTGGPDAGGAG